MTLRVVGAGLGRTGTHSLKLALERLLGTPCYHMFEVAAHPDHVPVWREAMEGRPVDWDQLLAGYGAIVDWPGAAVWDQIAAANPDALVLLSTRASAEQWWTSASNTIFEAMDLAPDGSDWNGMVTAMMRRFSPGWREPAEAKAAYERHNATVRATVAPSRLVEWQPEDGWDPLCAALGAPVPDEPFPVTNTTEQFRARLAPGPD